MHGYPRLGSIFVKFKGVISALLGRGMEDTKAVL